MHFKDNKRIDASDETTPPPFKNANRSDPTSKAKDHSKNADDAENLRALTLFLDVWSTETIKQHLQGN